jgi:hypothetical protein
MLRANHPAPAAVVHSATRASYTGGGSAYVLPSKTASPLQGIKRAAGSGTTVSYTQGLPTDTALPAIPSADLTPAYAPTPFGGTYSGTLTAPQTGTYVLALTNPCGCYTPTHPAQAPVVTFTVRPPSWAPAASSVLYATVGLGGQAQRQSGATVTITK